MKQRLYAVHGTVNGQNGFLLHGRADQEPCLACSNDIFSAALFVNQQDAQEALDRLRHGIAKTCRICAVEITPLP